MPWRSAVCSADEIGGPSVKPYQPPGYWVFLNFPTREYHPDHGDNQYRRGLYTYWQRTFLHPSLLAFDASTREECVVQRPRSNTPLQALVLLNDPTYVESARVLAARVIGEAGADPSARLDRAFRLALARPPAARRGRGPVAAPRQARAAIPRRRRRGPRAAGHRRGPGTRRHRPGRAGGLDLRDPRAAQPPRDDHPELTREGSETRFVRR